MRFTKKYTAIPLLLAVLMNCSLPQDKKVTDEVSLQFVGVNPSILKVSKPVFLGERSMVLSQKKNEYLMESIGLTQLSIELPVSMNLLVVPNDSLVIDLSGSKPRFSGTGSKLNSLIYEYSVQKNKLLQPLGDVYDWGQQLTEAEFYQKIVGLEGQLQVLAEAHQKQLAIDDSIFKQWTQLDRQLLITKYIVNYEKIHAHEEHPMLNAKVERYFPLNDALLNFPTLALGWSIQTDYLFLQQPLHRQDIFDLPKDSLMKRIINFDLDSNLKQLMLASLLEKDLTSFDTTLMGNFREEIEEILALKVLKSTIHLQLQEARLHLASSYDLTKNAWIGTYDVNKVLDQILKENKGKLIYMDIWATWCRPCLEEFKISREFKASIDSKRIAFVYVGAQSNQPAWNAIINKYQLEGTHLFLDDLQYDEFTKRYPIGFFPSYYLIDAKGKIVNEVANLSPSHPETVTMIQSLLNN